MTNAEDLTSSALNTLRQSNAIKVAWGFVEPDELATALRLMPARGRNQMLSQLRVPTAKVTTNTARLLISSLNRNPRERLKAAKFITRHLSHVITEALDDAIGEGRDPMEALTHEARELAQGEGASIVALTAIAFSYSEPDYHVPFLIGCAEADLLPIEFSAITEPLRALAPTLLGRLESHQLEGDVTSNLIQSEEETPLRAHLEAARASTRQIQSAVRDGRPVADDDVSTLSDYTKLLYDEARRLGLSGEISVELVERSERPEESLRLLANLEGPEEMSVSIDEIRELSNHASSEDARRLARFLALIQDPLPLSRITRAGELRLEPEPPARTLLDAAIAGVLRVEPETSVGGLTSSPPEAFVTDRVAEETPTNEITEIASDIPGRRTRDVVAAVSQSPERSTDEYDSATFVDEAVEIDSAKKIAQRQKRIKVSEDRPSDDATEDELIEQAESNRERELERASEVIADLVSAARFDLAHHVAAAAGQEYRASILMEAALAHAVRSPSSPAAEEMVDSANQPSIREDVGSLVLRLASTLRVALLDPGSGAPANLTALVGPLDQLPSLRDLARSVATATNQMVSIAAGGEILDSADAIAQAVAIAAWARDTRERPQHHFQFHRGFELWQAWSAPDGPVGEILALVASDDPEAVDIVREACKPYSTRDRVEAFIDQEDRRLREGRSGHPQPLVGSGRRQLSRAFVEIRDQAMAWCEARGRASGTDWSFEQREQLAVAIDELRADVVGTLRSLKGDSWLEATRDAALESIEATMGLFRHEPLVGSELDVESALDRGLALVIEVPLDEGGRPVRPPTLSELLDAASRPLSAAFEARLAAEQYGAAEILLDTMGGSVGDFDDEAARVLLASAERDALTKVTQEYNALYELFAAARARGRIDENIAPVLHSHLLGAEPGGPENVQRRDLGAVRSELTAIFEQLQEAIVLRRDQVRADIETAIGDGRLSIEWGTRLRELLEREELGAAEEYLYRAQAGEEPPADRRNDGDAALLSRALLSLEKSGLSDSIVEVVRTGGTYNELDFSAVPEIDRDAISTALSAWIELHLPERRSRWNALLPPVLRLLGIVPTTIETPTALRSLVGTGRFFVDVAGDRSGRAFVPSFGSRAQGRRRMMLAFESMPAGQLWDTAARGAMPDQPVYVLYVGTVSAEGRMALAREARRRETGQVVVIDDAVILACALAGRQAYDVTMRAVLPYAAANPYNPDLPGEIPEEMFYGRQYEHDSIANLTGASFVSGGRRFGKTALLHSVRKEYEQPQSNDLAIFVVIQHVAADPQQTAADLWPLLARRLTERKVLEASVVPDAEGVCAALRRWLEENLDRRLLLLLDECDLFLRADAEGGFRNVAELRNLMIDFGGRFKVVFSGLQHVARYLKLPNQPLSQLPPPIVIGPLDPSAACDLVRRPLEALGFAPTSSQVDRLVTYCACNPSVIQLAGMLLVERLREQSVTGLAPWDIDDRLLNRLLDSAELDSGVRNRLFLTLNLDHRYKLLAYLVAFRAINDGLGTVASPTELRNLALEYWPDGFSSQRPDDVRALCDELVGLGVFAGDADTGYRMLSPAAVRLFGTSDVIEGELTTAFESYVPDMALGAAGSRPCIEGDRYSPLSASQLADVVGQGRTQLRVVIGSRALCVEDVPAALGVAADAMPNTVVVTASSLRNWRELMTAPSGGHVVVVPEGNEFSRQSFEESVNAARQRGSTRVGHGTRSAVLVAGPHNRDVLRRLVATSVSDRPGSLADVVVALGRVDLDSLRAWARIEELDVVLPTQLARLLEVTGGWPKLIERLLLATRAKPFEDAADNLAAHLATVDGARELLADAGLDPNDSAQPADPGVLGVLRALVRHELEGDPATLAALLADDESTHESDPAEALAILQAIGVLATNDDGEVSVEHVIRQSLLLADGELSSVL